MLLSYKELGNYSFNQGTRKSKILLHSVTLLLNYSSFYNTSATLTNKRKNLNLNLLNLFKVVVFLSFYTQQTNRI